MVQHDPFLLPLILVRYDPVMGYKLSGVIGYTFLCLVEVDVTRGFRSGGAM
jgi:hypothetical protein